MIQTTAKSIRERLDWVQSREISLGAISLLVNKTINTCAKLLQKIIKYYEKGFHKQVSFESPTEGK